MHIKEEHTFLGLFFERKKINVTKISLVFFLKMMWQINNSRKFILLKQQFWCCFLLFNFKNWRSFFSNVNFDICKTFESNNSLPYFIFFFEIRCMYIFRRIYKQFLLSSKKIYRNLSSPSKVVNFLNVCTNNVSM